MAGRGRGRGGKASLSFHVSNLGFAPGEQLPTNTIQPPPSYPILVHRPTPLSSTEVDEYLLALSQEFRGSSRDSPFYLKPKIIKRDIVRYTDRYKHNQKTTGQTDQWEPNWSFLPPELKPATKRKPMRGGRGGKVNIQAGRKRKHPGGGEHDKKDIEKKLDTLIESEAKVDVNKNPEDEEEEEEVFEEDEFEDDNDYNFDYYNDGGDKYGDDDDGDGEGPVY